MNNDIESSSDFFRSDFKYDLTGATDSTHNEVNIAGPTPYINDKLYLYESRYTGNSDSLPSIEYDSAPIVPGNMP
jgi:hypothetical protein